MPESPAAGVHLELFVRSLSPRGDQSGQAVALRRLEALEGNGTIDGYEVQVCGRELPTRPSDAVTEFGVYLLNRIGVFQEWAARNGRSFGSLFEPEEVSSAITGERYTRLVMPMLVLAEYDDRALRFVSPCEGSDRTWSVPDRLAYLAREGDRAAEADGRLAAARGDPPERRLISPQ